MKTSRALARLAAVSATALALGATTVVPASAHGDPISPEAAAPGVALETSPNMELVSSTPIPGAISGVFAHSTKNFYVSSAHSISVYDTSDPADPVLTGAVDNLVFENEAMNYGERRNARTGKLEQFVLVGVDLAQASSDDPSHFNLGDGAEMLVIDVTDPSRPYIRSRITTVPSTHTVACAVITSCRYVYSAGNRGEYSIFDLKNLNRPAEVDRKPATKKIDRFHSPALAPTEVFTRGAGHKWNFDGRGHGVHTGAAGTAIFDVSRPRHPRLLTTTNRMGTAPGWNDFIHHNSFHVRPGAFRPNAAPALRNGNVLLITEEDYEQTDCTKAGSFQTWKIDSLRRDNAIVPLDKVELADLGGFSLPNQAFCSAHWFDYNQKGIAAVAFYGGGVRLIDVRDPSNIKSFGYSFGGGQTWDAYWNPRRNDKGVASAAKTNILYSVDLVRGLDVYRVNLNKSAGKAPAVRTAQAPDAGASHAVVGMVGSGAFASFVLLAAFRRRKDDDLES